MEARQTAQQLRHGDLARDDQQEQKWVLQTGLLWRPYEVLSESGQRWHVPLINAQGFQRLFMQRNTAEASPSADAYCAGSHSRRAYDRPKKLTPAGAP